MAGLRPRHRILANVSSIAMPACRFRLPVLGLLLFPVLVLLASCASVAAGPSPASEHAGLRVMSFNVRYASPGDGLNIWENRRELTVDTIVGQAPDIIGMQELLLGQAKYLQSKLPHHAWFGKGRNGNEVDGGGNEHMGVFYDTRHLKLLEQGDFWYSETPDVPGSANFDGPMPRMTTWGHFEDLRNGKRFYLFNTHFPHTDEAEALRRRCAQLLLERIERIAGTAPVVLTGDFNSHPGSAAHRLLTTTLTDAWMAAPKPKGPASTFHGFTGTPETDARIDWILLRHFGIHSVETIVDHRDALYPSDHYPVVADLEWP